MGVVGCEFAGPNVVGSAPLQDLRLSIVCGGLGLIKPRQGAVRELAKATLLSGGQPHLIQVVNGEP